MNNIKISYFISHSIPFLLGVFIFFNPFPHTTAIKEISFYVAFIIALYAIFSKKIDFSFDSPFSYPFLFYCLWSSFGLFFAENFNASLHDVLIHLIKYIVIYFLLINSFKTKRQFEILAWICFCSAAVFSIGAIIYYYGIAGYHPLAHRIDFKDLPLNIMGHVPLFAIALGIRLFSSVKSPLGKVLIFSSNVIMTILILFTYSRGSVLALVLVIFILIIYHKKVIIPFIVIFIIIFSALPNRFIQDKFDPSNRFEIWQNYINVIEKNPIAGLGFDLSFWQDPHLIDKYSLVIKSLGTSADPHNIFISNAVRVGIVGLCLYLFILYKFLSQSWILLRDGKNDFIRSWGLVLTAAFIAYLTKGLFDESLSRAPAIIFYTILAMQTILWKLNKEAEENTIVFPCCGEKIVHSDTVSLQDLSK